LYNVSSKGYSEAVFCTHHPTSMSETFYLILIGFKKVRAIVIEGLVLKQLTFDWDYSRSQKAIH